MTEEELQEAIPRQEAIEAQEDVDEPPKVPEVAAVYDDAGVEIAPARASRPPIAAVRASLGVPNV